MCFRDGFTRVWLQNLRWYCQYMFFCMKRRFYSFIYFCYIYFFSLLHIHILCNYHYKCRALIISAFITQLITLRCQAMETSKWIIELNILSIDVLPLYKLEILHWYKYLPSYFYFSPSSNTIVYHKNNVQLPIYTF